MPPKITPEVSVAKRKRLEALERSMGKSSSAGAKRPQAATAADHRDRREKKKKKKLHAAAAAVGLTATATAAAAATATSPSDALYYPLPQTGTVQEVLAACAKRKNGSSVFVSKTGNYSLLETALEQLSATTRRGAAGSEARGAALARVSEKALLLEDPTAGLASGGHEKNREAALENRGKGRKKKKKAKKSACGHSRPKASQLALAAAAAPRPKRAAVAKLRSTRALAATPAEAVEALEAQWKAYVRKLAASAAAAPSSSASFAPSALSALTLVGARARVAASRREAALVGRSGVVVAESRRAWHLFDDERGGKVSVVGKAGAELEVEFARGGGGEGEGEEKGGEGGEGEEALQSVVAIRVGGGALL